MAGQTTDEALGAITDEGLFERLATAVLREAEPICAALTHPGVNSAGKTVKSPVDGLCFVAGSNPPHLVAVHHTTTARDNLRKKWLHDPSSVRPRKGSRPTAPPGDLIKTAEIVRAERVREPRLAATLVLTTNVEPDEELVRDVEATARTLGLMVRIWSGSRLGHVLDNTPAGQWIRYSFLEITQQMLSAQLLSALSGKSLDVHRPFDEPSAWVPRRLDIDLTAALSRSVTFLIAGSGMGKSVACYRKIVAHVEAGGFGLVLSHESVASSVTIEQAISKTLSELHPALAAVGPSALSFCSSERPLLLLVEDINRSVHPAVLLERIASWSCKRDSNSPWRLMCPLWPEVLSSLGDQSRKNVESLGLVAGGFSPSEARQAVVARARSSGHNLSLLSADALAAALGHDPLLIALHDQPASTAQPYEIIKGFVERAISRAAADSIEYPSSQYWQALRTLGCEMLYRRCVDLPLWREMSGWPALHGETVRLISRLARHGEVVRLAGSSDEQRLVFRHDRVREWLLSDAAGDLEQQSGLRDELVEEPFFAEVVGSVLAQGKFEPSRLSRIVASNPLALFHAFRLLGPDASSKKALIVKAIHEWLDKPVARNSSADHLRWEALAVLAQTESPEVLAILEKLPDRTIERLFARLRNGDVAAGIELCLRLEPGVQAPLRDLQIEHAKLRFGEELTKALGKLLRGDILDGSVVVGALRFAGLLGDAALAADIETCWKADPERVNHLADYLWALGESCGASPERFLGPVCDAWAALSGQAASEEMRSPRDELAANEVRWAFQRWPPRSAIPYFVERAAEEPLTWPITYMLHGLDDPHAMEFVARRLAEIRRRSEGTGSFSLLPHITSDEWRRAQKCGRPMSDASRRALLGIWRCEREDKHLRASAFALWAATVGPDDLVVLRAVKLSDPLEDQVLAARLVRGDREAIPAMIAKLATDEHGYWWQFGRHLWSLELTQALEDCLRRREVLVKPTWGEALPSDRIIAELILRCPAGDAERLLLKYWSRLHSNPHFVQAALFLATPRLLAAARKALGDCPAPGLLLKHLGVHLGITMSGYAGLLCEDQVRALGPYLSLLSPDDVHLLWEACNGKGWFSLRRELIDSLLKQPYNEWLWDGDRFVSQIDQWLAAGRRVWMDHYIDRYLGTGVSWSEILTALSSWYEKRRSFDALQVVACALLHRGSRDDLRVLRSYEGMPEPASEQLIADTIFAVRRRRAN